MATMSLPVLCRLLWEKKMRWDKDGDELITWLFDEMKMRWWHKVKNEMRDKNWRQDEIRSKWGEGAGSGGGRGEQQVQQEKDDWLPDLAESCSQVPVDTRLNHSWTAFLLRRLCLHFSWVALSKLSVVSFYTYPLILSSVFYISISLLFPNVSVYTSPLLVFRLLTGQRSVHKWCSLAFWKSPSVPFSIWLHTSELMSSMYSTFARWSVVCKALPQHKDFL